MGVHHTGSLTEAHWAHIRGVLLYLYKCIPTKTSRKKLFNHGDLDVFEVLNSRIFFGPPPPPTNSIIVGRWRIETRYKTNFFYQPNVKFVQLYAIFVRGKVNELPDLHQPQNTTGPATATSPNWQTAILTQVLTLRTHPLFKGSATLCVQVHNIGHLRPRLRFCVPSIGLILGHVGNFVPPWKSAIIENYFKL